MMLSVIVPTRNEEPNIEDLIRRTDSACLGLDAELVFVDDSTDRTPEVITRVAGGVRLPVRLIRRPTPAGGLSGAVAEGIASSGAEFCVVMHGDLQHPPEVIPALLAAFEGSAAEVVVACRNGHFPGRSDNAADWFRSCVSRGARLLTHALFPMKLRGCSDPLSGFFAVRRATVNPDILRPSGSKFLLELLARHRLNVREVPFVRGRRMSGVSKTGLATWFSFVRQLGELRAGTAVLFAMVGAVGAVMNLMIMAMLHTAGVHYAVAAAVAAELTILSNFFLQEHLVFGTLRDKANSARIRFAQSFSYNNLDALLRLPFLFLAVDLLTVDPITAQAITLLAAFVLRYLFHSKIVYASASGRKITRLRQPVASLIRIKAPRAVFWLLRPGRDLPGPPDLAP